MRLFLVGAALVVTIPYVSGILIESLERSLHFITRGKKSLLIIAGILGGLGTFVFYENRIITDMYGDSRTLLSLLASKHYSLADLWRFDDTEPLSRLIQKSLSQILGLDQKLTIQIVSSIAGGLFLIVVLLFVANSKHSPTWKVLAAIILVSSGVNQLFLVTWKIIRSCISPSLSSWYYPGSCSTVKRLSCR